MILAVALNPALDVTYEVAELVPGMTNRVERVAVRAGGKAVNVARLLAAQGFDVEVVGFTGGPRGTQIQAELAATGIGQRWVPIADDTRQTVTVWAWAMRQATTLNEPGPMVSQEDWSALRAAFADGPPADAVVLSGSLPPGLPDDAYGELVTIAASWRAFVVLDTDGPGLGPGVAAGPNVVKPNRHELASATASIVTDPSDAITAAERLRTAGARAVVASLGPDALLAVTDDGAWVARPAAAEGGNATGAGDACVAGLVIATLDGCPWPDRLRLAAAFGAAAAADPVAGSIRTDRLTVHLDTIVVERV